MTVVTEELEPDGLAVVHLLVIFRVVAHWHLRERGPEQLADKLISMSFSKVLNFSSNEANARYFRGRCDRLRASKLEQMMRAIV